MRIHPIIFFGWLPIAFWLCPANAAPAVAAKTFRVSAIQESQVWIEGGMLDGLEQGMDGEVSYEIMISGQKKRIVPAKVRLTKVEDHQSVGNLREQSGIVNIGYSASFAERPVSDLLLVFNRRASESYSGKDFSLAQQYYRKILLVLPGDAFALQKIQECGEQIDKLNALSRERLNIPYYRQVIRTLLNSSNPESLKLAQTYADKILLLEPSDPESVEIKNRAISPASESVTETAKAKPEPPVSPTPTPPRETAQTQPVPSEPVVEKKNAPEPKLDAATSSPGKPDPLENMVLIPEGDYPNGSVPGKSPFENESPRHLVHLASFYIDRNEVTNEEYKKFCDATGRSYPGYFSGKDYPPGSARKPVVMISWIDADAYARWVGKRLPSEAEWEAAAAGLSGRTWPWGDNWSSNEANTREKGEDDAAEVGTHLFDQSEFGVYDMAGNVSEWTQDYYKPYPGNSRKEKEYGEQFRVLRGGSSKASKEFARSQFRARLPDGFRSRDLGFRCVVSKK
jgi:formylglycine-generating enzyme required for sulfatase activity